MGCPWDAMGKGAVGKRDGTEKNVRKEHHAMTPGEIIIICYIYTHNYDMIY